MDLRLESATVVSSTCRSFVNWFHRFKTPVCSAASSILYAVPFHPLLEYPSFHLPMINPDNVLQGVDKTAASPAIKQEDM